MMNFCTKAKSRPDQPLISKIFMEEEENKNKNSNEIEKTENDSFTLSESSLSTVENNMPLKEEMENEDHSDSSVEELVENESKYPPKDAYEKVIKFYNGDLKSSPLYESLASIEFNNDNDLESRLFNKEFMDNFAMLTKSSPFKDNDPFSVNLTSFVTKFLLIMRQKYPNIEGEDQEKWKNALKNMKLLNSALQDHYFEAFNDIICWDVFDNENSARLFKLECLRNWKSGLKSRFENLLSDIYSKQPESLPVIISKHFNKEKEENLSMNFKSYINKDPLLGFLWKYQDPISWIKYSFLAKDSNLPISNSDEEMENFELKRNRISNLYFDSFSSFDLESDLKLLIKSKSKIHSEFSKNYDQILDLMEVFEKINQLTWRNLLNVFDLKSINEISKHLKLKNFFEKIQFNGETPFVYTKIVKLGNDYEEELESKRLKSNAIKIKSLQYEEFYERILQDLGCENPFDSEFIKENKLEFGRMKFPENLYKLMMSKSKSLDYSFSQHDFQRLFFKWIIYMNEEIKDEKDFKIFLEIMNPIYEKLKSCFPSPFLFLSLDDYLFSSYPDSFELLFSLEFYERIKEMLPKLNSTLDTFYNPGPNQGNCQRLKSIHFGGRFENNLILASMIRKFDKFKKSESLYSIEKCILNPQATFKNELGSRPSNAPKDFLGKIHYSKLYDYRYINRHLLSTLNETKTRYGNEAYFIGKISQLDDFKTLLSILKRIRLLNQETIKNLFRFSDSGYNWNGNQFNEFKKKMNEKYPSDPLNKDIEALEFESN